MARTPDQMKLRYAQTFGAAKAVEDMALLHPDRAVESRHQWPELWEKVDALFVVMRSRT